MLYIRLLKTAVCIVLLSACQIGRFKPGVVQSTVISELKMQNQMTMAQPIKGKDMLLVGLAGAALGAAVPYSPAGAYSMGSAMGGMSATNSKTKQHEANDLELFFKTELRKQLKQQLTTTGLIKVHDQGDAESKMKVTVFNWGFTNYTSFMPNAFSSKVTAFCDVFIEVKTNEGKIVWKSATLGAGPMGFASKLKAYRFDEFLANPALQKQELGKAAQLAAESLATILQKEAAMAQPR